MSDVPPQPQPGDAPSEEEVREYLAQMRQAPAEQVVAEVLQGLLNAAQIKLGRRDARLLLDTAASIVDQTRPHMSSELTTQVDDALQQLRMAQVEAEQQVAQAPEAEANDIDATVASAGADESDATASTPPPAAPGPGASKLWVPGR